jgi:Ca2+-transporting ATPase
MQDDISIVWHELSREDLLAKLGTPFQSGLTPQEAASRLKTYGPNQLQEKPRPTFLQRVVGQLNNFVVIMLIVAAIISAVLGEWVDATAILTIVVLNAVLGVVQESRAEEALAALKKMAAPEAHVIRGGRRITVPARELVPGDIVYLEAGNFVPADMRLLDAVNLKVEEAALTGESVPVQKNAALMLDRDIPLGDRKNTAFMGTVITYGRGKGLVTCTGMNTQIGLIAQMIQSFEDEETPLQRKLAHLGKVLGTACLAICAIVFVYGLFRDTHIADVANLGLMHYLEAERRDIVNLFMTAVSLAIAAVPEGLPAIVTICLALGMQRMIKHHALIRKLPAVETLRHDATGEPLELTFGARLRQADVADVVDEVKPIVVDPHRIAEHRGACELLLVARHAVHAGLHEAADLVDIGGSIGVAERRGVEERDGAHVHVGIRELVLDVQEAGVEGAQALVVSVRHRGSPPRSC